ncbi:hypothetical protein GCM10025734_28540 [Kitasatospora paranensis]
MTERHPAAEGRPVSEGRPAPHRRGSLARNIVLLTTAVAALAVALTGLIAWQTAAHGTEQRERDRLGRQATLLSRMPDLSQPLFDGAQALGGPNGERLAVLGADGAIAGAATPAVDLASRADLLAGRPVDTRGVLGGEEVLLVGRPGPRGGAVVLTEPYAVVARDTDRIRRNTLLPLVVGMVGAALAGGCWPAGSPARWSRRRGSRTGSPTANAAYGPGWTGRARPRRSAMRSTSWTARWCTARTASASSCCRSRTSCARR